MKKSRYEYPVPEHQPDAGLNQDNPVSGTKYEWKAAAGAGAVLGDQKNVRILSVTVAVIWSVQPTPLEVWVTIDGVSKRYYFVDPATGVYYHAGETNGGNDDQIMSTTSFSQERAFLLEGRSIKIEVETTGGTVSNLSARVKYAKW